MGEVPLEVLTIGITAERAAETQAELLHGRGAKTLHGPTLRIVSLIDDEILRATTIEVARRPPDFLLATTGFGMRAWLGAAETWACTRRS